MKSAHAWFLFIFNKFSKPQVPSNISDSVVQLLNPASFCGGNGIVLVLAASRDVGDVDVKTVNQGARK